MFKPDYVEFLQTFRLPDFHLDIRDGQLLLEFSGERYACPDIDQVTDDMDWECLEEERAERLQSTAEKR